MMRVVLLLVLVSWTAACDHTTNIIKEPDIGCVEGIKDAIQLSRKHRPFPFNHVIRVMSKLDAHYCESHTGADVNQLFRQAMHDDPALCPMGIAWTYCVRETCFRAQDQDGVCARVMNTAH